MHEIDFSDPLASRMEAALKRYGSLASTHEALGVAMEEFDELRAAIHANKRESIREEALDLAAVLLRLWIELQPGSPMDRRSGK